MELVLMRHFRARRFRVREAGIGRFSLQSQPLCKDVQKSQRKAKDVTKIKPFWGVEG
jgi:hypothetical protein